MAGARAAWAGGSGIWGASFGHSSSQVTASSGVRGKVIHECVRARRTTGPGGVHQKAGSHPLDPQPQAPCAPGLTRRLFFRKSERKKQKVRTGFCFSQASTRGLGTVVGQGYWSLGNETCPPQTSTHRFHKSENVSDSGGSTPSSALHDSSIVAPWKVVWPLEGEK